MDYIFGNIRYRLLKIKFLMNNSEDSVHIIILNITILEICMRVHNNAKIS